MIRVGINGLGRIGRCLFRILCDKVQGIDLVAVNGSSDPDMHIHLLKHDSIHGQFQHDMDRYNDFLVVGDKKIKFFHQRDPKEIPWSECGVDVVLECTGKFNSKELSSSHIKGTVNKVLVSAPVKDADIQVISGVNDSEISGDHKIISAGSCTTNCAAHVVKVMDEKFGIESGFITTVHAYTGDQNHTDRSHKDLRRARACGISMIPTSTGASKALEQIFPHLRGKLAASAIRVPTPNVSVVDFTCYSKSIVTSETINEALSEAADASGGLLMATKAPLVSIDFNHTTYSAIFDLKETYVAGSNFSRVLAWYDNEWAFAQRMVEITAKLAALD